MRVKAAPELAVDVKCQSVTPPSFQIEWHRKKRKQAEGHHCTIVLDGVRGLGRPACRGWTAEGRGTSGLDPACQIRWHWLALRARPASGEMASSTAPLSKWESVSPIPPYRQQSLNARHRSATLCHVALRWQCGGNVRPSRVRLVLRLGGCLHAKRSRFIGVPSSECHACTPRWELAITLWVVPIRLGESPPLTRTCWMATTLEGRIAWRESSAC